jgi:hypothetical protein
MMTEPEGMYGEELRQALGAVANLVLPDGDGLDKIRQRTRHRSPAFAWLVAYSTYLPRALVNMVRVPGSELLVLAKGQSTVFKRTPAKQRVPGQSNPGQGNPGQKPRSPQQWLRPVIAAAGALVFVVAVLLAVPRLRETITPVSVTNPGASATATNGHGGPAGAGETVGATQDKIGPAPEKTGFGITVPPPGASRNGKCPNAGSASGTSRPHSGKTTHCPSAGSSASSSPPGSSTSPGSPGSPSSAPPTGSSPVITPGGGPPTPTTSAITNTPDPSDTGGGS